MPENLIFALHGFLGRATDWHDVKSDLASQKPVTWLAPDLFSTGALPVADFDKYSDQLLDVYKNEIAAATKKIFIGYSLGGRLGLNILKSYPDLFDHFVFISTNPGIDMAAEAHDEEKKARLANDARWAEKIKTETWPSFLSQWNAQPVFSKLDHEPKREKVNYDLDKLVDSLTKWSLGNQTDMRSVIRQHRDKITWVVGQSDSKFLTMAEDLTQKKILLGYNKIFSGHRILFSNPKDLAKLLQNLF